MSWIDVLTHAATALAGGTSMKLLDLFAKREQGAPAAETERAEITARHRTHEIDTAAGERRIKALEAKVDELREETIADARAAAMAEARRIEKIAKLEGTVEGLTRKVEDLERDLAEERQARAEADANNRLLLQENERLRRGGS